MAASGLISQGIGSPADIFDFLTLGLRTATGLVYPTFRLEFDLGGGGGAFDPAYFDPAYFDVSGWTDVTGDVRTQDLLVCEYGIVGNTPTDRIASTGRLSFSLDNSQANSEATIGLYSLLNANHRAGLDLNIPVRLVLSAPGVPEYYKFLGRLDVAPADPGVWAERIVYCAAVDLMDDWASTDEPDLETQAGKRSDELLTALLDAMATDQQPSARTIETGLGTYPYALDGGTGQRLSIRERMNQIVLSEYGKAFLSGDTDLGGRFVFQNRHHAPLRPAVLFRLDNDMTGLELETSRAKVFRSVQVTVHPTNDVAIAATVVLYELKSAQIYIAPGDTNDTLFGPYRDPDTNDQIGGTDIEALVPGTDYVFNTKADGTGSDLTGAFTVTASATGSGVRWTIVNTGGVGAFVRTLQLRGKPIQRNTLLIETLVAGGYGRQVLQIEMPYQDNANVGADLASYLASVLSTPGASVTSVRFLANKSAAHMAAAIQLEPGDRIALSETVTGLTNEEFIINGVRLELQTPNLLWCTWTLEASTATHYWLIGVPGASELGETTVLGF